MINIRAAAAGLDVGEVGSIEHERIHGESNLNTFRDGFRVLRTIFSEYGRMRRRHRSGARGTGGVIVHQLPVGGGSRGLEPVVNRTPASTAHPATSRSQVRRLNRAIQLDEVGSLRTEDAKSVRTPALED